MGVSDNQADFRDHIATVDKKGKRVWMYPQRPVGRYYRARGWMTLVFLAFFLGMPFIKVDGEQFLLFNVLERRFVLFGILFTPQDFHLFVLAMLTFLVFIILFTVVFGRLFCGWVCPQTVFMEMIFRKIEYWIEGDAPAQRRLDQAGWSVEKVAKKVAKHSIFILISVVVANYFLAYLIGMDQVLKIISSPVSEHFTGFVAMLVFSFLFYGVFARMREQVCTTICPYGRLQGVLLAKDSIVVAYDYVRGEPRSKKKKGEVYASDTGAVGDCIDCKLCVAVCPTGIDIRNGTQLECTNCTACMDACDLIMDRVDRPAGLIRYDSKTGIEDGRRKIFTPRVWGYTIVLSLLLLLDVSLLVSRGAVESLILRAPGQLYQVQASGLISNLYSFVIINKTRASLPVRLELINAGGEIRFVGEAVDSIPKSGRVEGAFFIDLPASKLKGRKTPLELAVYSNNREIDRVRTNFLGPQ